MTFSSPGVNRGIDVPPGVLDVQIVLHILASRQAPLSSFDSTSAWCRTDHRALQRQPSFLNITPCLNPELGVPRDYAGSVSAGFASLCPPGTGDACRPALST